MKVIPSCFYTKPLLKLIDSLIDERYMSYESLSDADRDNVVALCMDALGEDAYECIIDSSDTISNLQKFMISGKKDDALDLAFVMRESAAKYFKDPMTWLFEERLNEANAYLRLEQEMFKRHKNNDFWRQTA